MEPFLASPEALAERTGRSWGDPDVQDALRRASARFRGAVGHPVSRVVGDAIVLNGDGSNLLLLPAAPVVAVTEVKLDDVAITDWELAEDGRLRRWSGWPNAYRNVAVTYTHGYDPVPEDVSDAVLDAAEGTLNANPGVTSMAVGGESVTFDRVSAGGVTQAWIDTVERYHIGRDRP